VNVGLKVIEEGDELAIAFPPEMLEKLGVKLGDSVMLTETPNGFHISTLCDDSGTNTAPA
jgi:hypothetical protein